MIARCIELAGESPVRVSAGAPGEQIGIACGDDYMNRIVDCE